MKLHHHHRLTGVLSGLCLALLLSACASPAIEEARQLGRTGQHEMAIGRLKAALDQSPDDRSLRLAMIKQQDEAVSELAAQFGQARAAGRGDEAKQVLKRLDAVAPQHPRTTAMHTEFNRATRLERLMQEADKAYKARAYDRAEVALRSLLSEDAGNRRARDMLGNIEELRAQQTRQQSTLTLATAQRPITLEFREAALKNVFEALSRAANISFVFDKDVRGDTKITLFLKNTTVDEAMRVILNTQQLSAKLLNDSTVLVFPNTQQKQRDVLDTVTRTFYLTNADTKQAQALVRTVAKTRDVFIDERLNMLVVRDTPEVVRLIERLIQGLDLPDPEVVLELEIIEVSSKKLDQIGISWPDTVNFGIPGGTSPITVDSSPFRFYTANPLAIANIKSTRGASNLLANPKIRARNREKVKVLLGEKLPVFTTTSTANVGVSASVSYLDVGLKLDIEPTVQLDNDVSIKVALEVSTITNTVNGPSGSIAYQVGTRQATTALRLRDGETQVLAGLISDNESRSSAGLPGLHEIPIAGRLFGSTNDSHDKTEVVMLVTPHIVRNIVQPASAVALMPSGTEAQPGSPALFLRAEASSSSSAVGGNGAAPTSVQPATAGRPGAAAEQGIRVTGPEEVQPGAVFEITIHNPGATPLTSSLFVDSAVFETIAGKNVSLIPVNLPPGGRQIETLRAKRDLKEAEATFSLTAEGTPLHMRVRYPTAADVPPESPSEAPADPEQAEMDPDNGNKPTDR
jgi:general secretion pathway protein D